MIIDSLVVAWWNTGLSPVGKSRGTINDLDIACQIVKCLVQDIHVDFLGLGEITKNDLEKLLGAVGNSSYTMFDGTLREGRAQFDTGAIYNNDHLIVIDNASLTDNYGSRRLKLANRIDFRIDGDVQPFHLFISHWPSHITPDSAPLRVRLATRLRDSIDKVMSDYDGNARLILMGDFNEEPFHDCLENHLLASRDRGMAKYSPTYLYNPFWRLLGESAPYVVSRPVQSFSGTVYVASGNATKWKTVDQIIVSSDFLGRSDWHLNEEHTQVLHITPRCTREKAQKDIFDHFPVMTAIERIEEEKGV